ncbi:metallo-endopeptidase [Metarhizium acridum CQMa 102]|uniref:Neutral protease 2 n=1 Tax=Metarhizium acridum (strain CQMa 102) TaxID=655827 RepID=E9EG55_METAQ|nr:metallo-endopeptidase [Metarhizium acridum CQMa 102]EFY85093.1 metallo-endopeptidase [Metarhizium acridum CQMa 102]
MKPLASLAALVSLAATAPQAARPLDVQFQMDGNSAIRATITNNGKKDLKIFRTGTILDSSAIQKTRITDVDGKAIPFIRRQVRHPLIGRHALCQRRRQHAHRLRPLHNSITAEIHGSEAGSVLKSFLRADKRANFQSDCTGQKLSVTQSALSNCARLASAAPSAASSNDAKVNEYFKDSSASTKNTAVSEVLGKVATECGLTNGGVSKYYAPTSPITAQAVLPALTSQCHAQNQATTDSHEITHLRQIKGTADNGYGYQNAMKLDTQNALNNADTYALFSNAIQVNC